MKATKLFTTKIRTWSRSLSYTYSRTWSKIISKSSSMYVQRWVSDCSKKELPVDIQRFLKLKGLEVL